MKIVVLVPKLHAGAELALNKLLRNKGLNIIGVVRSDVSPFKKQYWRYALFGVRRSGVFYGALIALTVYWHLIGLAIASVLIWRRRKKWLSLDKLIEKHNLKLHDTSNINSKKSMKIIESWKPDVMVSMYFDQILKKSVINIPTKTTLNMHPGLLPRYRGLWPEFWKLYNGEKYAGVSIHHMNEKIDAGEVIAQTKFPIQKDDTKFSLALRSARYGTKLLIKTLKKLKRGIKIKPLKLKGKPKYYSIPNKSQFDTFYATGRRMFSVLGMKKEFDQN